MEKIRQKLSVLRELLNRLDDMHNEYAEKRSQWEMVRIMSGSSEELEKAKSALLDGQQMIDKFALGICDLIDADDIQEVRSKFSDLANCFNIVVQMEEGLTKRRFWYNAISETNTAPVDWDDKEGEYDRAKELERTNNLDRQLSQARRKLAEIDGNVPLRDLSNLIVMGNTIVVPTPSAIPQSQIEIARR